MRKDIEELKKLYADGFSCAEIGKMIGISRQSVHETLTRVKVKFREKKVLPFLIFDGKKWTVSKTTGYYRLTNERKKHISLHCYVWEKYNGKIPKGFDIHHKDLDKTNNSIENLEIITHSEHAKKYSTGRNQYSK